MQTIFQLNKILMKIACRSLIYLILNFRKFKLLAKMPTLSLDGSWQANVTFLVEGVILLTVACLGLVGNILSFIVLGTWGIQKIFHNLLLLLNIFDMVSTKPSIPWGQKLSSTYHSLPGSQKLLSPLP